MANYPKVCAKVTTHKPPRYMLYQPGFNESNSCWLRGKWLYVSKEEWEEKHELQNDMYSNLRGMSKDQHHRDGPIDPSDMNPAQKQAFEFFSGTVVWDCMIQEEYFSPLRVHMAAMVKVSEKDIEWMRKKKFKFIKYVEHDGKAVEQMKGIEVPEDMIIDMKKPVNTIKMTIDQNKDKTHQMFRGLLKELKKGSFPPPPRDLVLGMVMHSILELEENIIRAEWEDTRWKKNPYHDTLYKDDVKTYVEQRAELKDFLKEYFDPLYNALKEEQNKCEKANLENSDYSSYCFVLPKFNDDGTHEPWTDKDVPNPEKLK